MARGNFSPATKARIYAWDNAVCSFTGANLWMLDHGVSPLAVEEWADHIAPARRGGTHEPSNGISASAEANWTKGANGRNNTYLFIAGQPTWAFFSTMGKVPDDVAIRLKREVVPTDWYFNRCIANLMWSVIGRAEGWTGTRVKKKPMYYPRAAFGFLSDWRDRREDEWLRNDRKSVIREWRGRGLLPKRLAADQRLLLEVIDAESPADVNDLVNRLIKYYKANARILGRFDRWVARANRKAGQRLLGALQREPLVSTMVKGMIRHNVHVLAGLKTPRDDGNSNRDTVRRYSDYE